MELLCLTGVEDKLQDGVRPTLEMLKNAGIKVRTNEIVLSKSVITEVQASTLIH